jgi:hypothetical protein
MSELKILYKLTSRSRPKRWLETLDSITKNSLVCSDYFVLTSIDDDDHTMHNFLVANQYDIGHKYHNGMVMSGNSKNKIDAINRDMNEIDKWYRWDILVNISDDMLITSSRFEDVLRIVFSESLDLFLHLPDGFQNRNLPTMSIMGRDYYERFNYIYHPSYQSVYCDNEAMDVAKSLGKYLYVNEHLFVHNHPSNIGKHVWDNQYEKTEDLQVHAQDSLNYQNRKQLHFP